MARSANFELSIWCLVILWPVLTSFRTLGYFFIFLLTSRRPQNPWQVLAKPLGSAEPRLKITVLYKLTTCTFTFTEH